MGGVREVCPLARIAVDADYLVYSCGFAVERVLYDVMVERPDGTTDSVMCRYKHEVDAYLSDERDSESQVDVIVDAEPLENALFLANRVLSTVDAKLTEQGVEFDQLELFLTGSGNFREELATIKGYKANRVDSRKPVHYASLRRYLRNKWGAQVVRGWEADDECSMLAYQHKYGPDLIVVSMDKDLWTFPGWRYHFKRRKLEYVTPEQARLNFYRQLLTGDTIDNIGGCFKCGEKRANALLNEQQSEDEQYSLVLGEYEASLTRKGCPYVNLGAEAALLENARLLHMLRWPGDLWHPPTVRDSSEPLPPTSGKSA